MFKKIVVGYDGSDQGKDAMALARVFAAPSSATVIAACVYPYERIVGKAEGGDRAYHAALQEEAIKIVSTAEGATDRRTVPRSSPSRGIHELAEEEKADLIVVGSTHHGTVGKVLIGSVGERLLHGSHCPVAIAPKGFADAGDGSLKRIAMGYDDTPEANSALKLATQLALDAGGELHVYSAVEPPGANTPTFTADYGWDDFKDTVIQTAKDRLDEAVAGLPPEVQPKGDVLVGKAAETLANEVGDSADVLVVGSRGYGQVRGVLLGRVSAELARSAPCPVLVVPRSAEVPLGTPEETGLAPA